MVTQHHFFDERGLLGIAFHPNYRENGKFYLAYSVPVRNSELDRRLWWSHTNIVSEFQVSKSDPNKADPTQERVISQIDWPQFNHNGHWIAFGPDGMLYLSTGDGGYANDWGIGHNVTMGNGQDKRTLLGKILRLDINKPDLIPADNPLAGQGDALPQIWAYGLRNPWRCSFDMADGSTLYCGDVQQNSIEEVNVIAQGDNLGWRTMEADQCFDYLQPDAHPPGCDQTGLKLPIMHYDNCTARPSECKGISITGGYIYRGSHADWDGKYIFGDWSKSFATRDGQIFIGTKNGDTWSFEVADTGMAPNPYILAFAQDSDGEVYALTSISTGPTGDSDQDTIYKIVPGN
jgi:hypothetical protein